MLVAARYRRAGDISATNVEERVLCLYFRRWNNVRVHAPLRLPILGEFTPLRHPFFSTHDIVLGTNRS